MSTKQVEFCYQISGLFGCALLQVLSIYELFLLRCNNQKLIIYGILSCWLLSKLLALICFIVQKNQHKLSFNYFIFTSVFPAEWLFICYTQYSIKFLIIQYIVLTYPINLCNMFLLSYYTDSSSSYYIALIIVNYIFMSVFIFYAIAEYGKKEDNNSNIYYLSSIFSNFCFWYLLIQTFIQNLIFGVSIVALNLIVFLFDLKYFKNDKNENPFINNQDFRFYKALLYVFQINYIIFTIYSSNCKNLKLKTWGEIFGLGTQCLNIIVLSSYKFKTFPFLTEIDKIYYVFVTISLMQIILFIINLYFKIIKKNKFHFQTELVDGKFQLDNQGYRYLNERFTYDYLIYIKVDISCIEYKNFEQFTKSILQIRDFKDYVIKNSKHQVSINISSSQQEFQINFQYYPQLEQNFKQSVIVKNSLYQSKPNIQLLRNLCLLLKNDIQTNFQIDSCHFHDMYKCLLDLQSFNQINFNFIDYFKSNNNLQLKSKEIILNILSQVKKDHIIVLCFHKYCSQFLYQNPITVCYDLNEEN